VGTAVGLNRIGGVLGPIAIGYEQSLAHPIAATFAGLVIAQIGAAIVLRGGSNTRKRTSYVREAAVESGAA
jgi:hypothetical protein